MATNTKRKTLPKEFETLLALSLADIGGGVAPTITTTDVALQQQFWDHFMNLGVTPPGPRP